MPGLGVPLENATLITDIENAIELMLEELQRSEKRLLITVDEVIKSEYIKIFGHKNILANPHKQAPATAG